MRSPAFSLSLSVLLLAACPPPSSMETESDASSSSSSSSSDPSSTGITTSTVTSTTTATHSTTQTSTTDSSTTDSSTSTGGDTCNYDLTCDPDEDLLDCLHDCGTCNSDGSCGADETPYACPDDCDATACDGDAIVDALTEQCDDGNQSDDDACTNACVINVCGDGHLFAEKEECDDGNVVSGDGCSAGCVTERRTVFVTSTEYKGNLGGPMNGLSGLDLADSLCQKRADMAGRGGTFKAWLSDANLSPSTRFGLGGFSGIFELPDGTEIASGWGDLVDGSLAHAIDMDENGNVVDPSLVWSNTKINAAPKGSNHCSGWTSNALEVNGSSGGSSSAAAGWTDASLTSCSGSARLYCFQVE